MKLWKELEIKRRKPLFIYKIFEYDKKWSVIIFTSIGKIQTIIAAPKTGLNRKLNWKTFTCGAVLDITPKIIS